MTDNWNPRDLAAPLSNEALADLIRELGEILNERLNAAVIATIRRAMAKRED